MATSPTSKKSIYIVLPIGFLLLTAVGFMVGDSIPRQAAAPKDPQQLVSRLSEYRLPDTMSFCGERMPLEIPDVRERMEQSFYIEMSDAQIILDLKRSAKYFPYIDQKLRDMNLPSDLKYLAVAESALRNLVSSRQAAGIWQFTDDTARRYGLIVNGYVDERFNFHKATDAAMRYLSDLYTSFGSWSLAAAAYNMGSGGVRASLNYQMVNSYYSLYLNDETSRFVFRIVALKQIMSHYKMYGFDLNPSDFYAPPETKLVVVTHIPDLASWARQEGSSYKEIKYLNPWIIERSLPSGTWAIEVPKYAQPVVFTLSSPVITDTADSSDSDQLAAKTVDYRVKRGDSLESIADRFGVSVRDIVEWNDLGTRRYVRIGEKLRIILPTDNSDE